MRSKFGFLFECGGNRELHSQNPVNQDGFLSGALNFQMVHGKFPATTEFVNLLSSGK